MTAAYMTILGPLSAASLALVLRRAPAMLALLGTLVGLVGASLTLAGVAGGARYGPSLPGLPGLPLRLAVEPLTAVLSVLVAVVGFLVMVYAVGYIGGEEGRVRFFAQMSFFVAAMQTVVLAGDWVLLLAAWELIGFSSYLLIGFYLQRAEAAAGATRAFLYTRSADLGLYVAIFVLVASTGTSEIAFTLGAGGAVASIAGLALLVAAAGKSAQAPFYGWLQDAMAGPTPVSALLHSATLVAAGAILMIRTYPLLPPGVLLAVGLLGGLTALIAGLVALAQRDLKRLLAASTSSQYGFMLLALGAGVPFAAVAYLIAHAAIKCSLFLGAGVFQQARGSTDLDDLGGVARERRWTFAGFAVAGLALAGIPPLSGFWSKDAVLAASFEGKYTGLLAPLALAGTLLTGVYVARALRLLWRGDGHGSAVAGAGWMGAGLAGLVILAATLGLVLQPLAQLLGTQPPNGLLVAAIGLLSAVAGLFLGWLVPAGRLLGPLHSPAERGFRVGGGFHGLVARPALAVARGADAFDGGIHAGVLGAGRLGLAVAGVARRFDERGIDGLIAALVGGTRSLGARARTLQSGLVHKELLLAVVGGAVIFVLLTVGSW
jgi:NADH-quinone oxidoreductase subunit L